MKKILLFIAAIACFYSCTEEEHQTTRLVLLDSSELYYHDQVRKGVKSITINGYSVEEKFGKQEKHLEETLEASYDKAGKIEREKINNLSGELSYEVEHEYTYYGNGEIKKIISSTINLESKRGWEVRSRYVKEFDGDGSLIKETGYDKNGIPCSPNKVCQYDEKKQLIEETYLITTTVGGVYKEETRKTNYIYNDKGWLVEEKTSTNGVIDELETYKYDKKGNCIETIRYDREGEIDSKAVFEYKDKNSSTCTVYDGDGNMISKTERTPDELIIYGENGDIDEKYIIEDEKVVEHISDNYIWRIEYNRKGDCTKVTRYRSYRGKETVENITECEYTYY